MKRRPFLTSISALGLGSMISMKSEAKSTENPIINYEFFESSTAEIQVLQKLENEFISFTWMSDASAQIIDKINGATCRMASVAIQEDEEIERNHVWIRQDRSIFEQYPGRFKGEMKDEKITFTLYDLEKQIVGTFKCKAVL